MPPLFYSLQAIAAAIEAADARAKVALIEVDKKLGGSTALSGGVYYAADTSVQKTRGFSDSVDAMFEYYMTLNQYRVDASLARTLCEKAGSGVEWLIELGVNFPPDGLYCSGVESVARGHPAAGSGAGIAEVLQRAVSKRSIDVVLNTRLTDLVIDPVTRAVRGVRIGDDVITANAVVLATGGFGANPYFRNRYYPDAAAQADRAWYIGNEHCVGDGLVLGEQAGAHSMFFNMHEEMKPVATAPFYAVEIFPAIVCLTSTGLRINQRTQVLNARDEVIQGLYAAGETTGGVLGERYIGGGNSIVNAIVFGRIAGQQAAGQVGRNE